MAKPEPLPADLDWDDPRLQVPSDPKLRATYRLAQSRHRQDILKARYGFHGKGAKARPVGSLLADDEVARRPGLNFFDDGVVVAYLDKRIPAVRAEGGALEEHRLRHNMLSSMPMAFTMTAWLRSAPDRDEIVRVLFGIDCKQALAIDAEWAPTPRDHLADKTAFDMVLRYRTSSGSNGILGIESKYTEPFSQKPYDTPRYRQVTEDSGWFRGGAANHLLKSPTNQLWRNTMLAASMHLGGEVQEAGVAVVGLAEDTKLWKAVDAMRSEMTGPDRVLPRPWEQLLKDARGSSIESKAEQFAERYLRPD